MVIRELLVAFGVETDTAKLETWDQRIQAAKRHMGEAGASASAAAGEIRDLGLAFAAAAAAAAGASGALLWNAADVSQTALLAERQADAFGLTAESYQELRAAFAGFNVDHKDLADMLGQITQQAKAAEGGATGIVEAFADLGLSVDEVAGKSPEEILYAIARGASSTDDVFKRLAGTNAILGEDLTKKTLPLLMQGAAGLDAARKSARDLGVVMSDETVSAGAELAKTGQSLQTAWQGVRNEVAARMLPTLRTLADQLLAYVQTNRKAISVTIDRWAGRAADAFKRLGLVIEAVDRVVRAKLGGWERIILGAALAVGALSAAWASFKLGSAFYFATSALLSVGAAVGALVGAGTFSGLALFLGILTPLIVAAGIFVVEVGAIVFAISELYTWLTSSTGRINEWANANRNAIGSAQLVARSLDEARRIGLDLYRVFGALVTITGNVFRPILAALAPVIDEVGAAMRTTGEALIVVDDLWKMAKWNAYHAVLKLIADAVSLAADGLERLAAFDFEAIKGNINNTIDNVAGMIPGSVTGAGASAAGGLADLADSVGGFLPDVGGYLPDFAGMSRQIVAQQGATSGGVTNNRGGDTVYQITGAQSPEAVAAEIERLDARRRRGAAASFAGGER